MDASTSLCDSLLCRLCGEENESGTLLYQINENKENLSEIINKYLPIKIEQDGKFPCTLCPGCTIQLDATKSFFDLIVQGQNKLRDIYLLQEETKRREAKRKEQLQNALQAVSPNSSVQTYTVQADETGEKIFIQILSEGPLFSPEHEIALKVNGLDKQKRRRGRPPKSQHAQHAPQHVQPVIETIPEEIKEQQEEEIIEYDANGKRKRRIKKPLRYSELIQGKELDRIFKEEGVADEDDGLDSESRLRKHKVEEMKDGLTDEDEIIGHMQGKDGENLGHLIVVSKNGSRIKSKPKTKKREKFECDICGRAFLHLGRLELHKSCHKDIKFGCKTLNCDESYQTKLELEEHQQNMGHSGITVIESLENYGQVEVNSTSSMAENSNIIIPNSITENGNKRTKFQCELCDKMFSCKQNYEMHIKTVHEKQRSYACDKCDKKFCYPNLLQTHMLQHAEKTYPCETCDKVFNHPSSLVYHREAEHNNGRRFVCNKCKKSFKHKQLLLRHQLVHSNERPYACKYCGASFKSRANLFSHMPTHTGEKKFFCSQCGQSFAHKTSLTLHMRWHSGQKPYKCDVCLKAFSQKGNLAEHRRIHTGEKPYGCTYCNRRFTTSSQYKLHVKRHTGERPWKCEFCSKSFLHRDTWKCHTRRHKNEKPFQCQHCFRSFTEQWALRKHERLHTGEKPYVCEICDKKFADSSNLTKHKTIHWNIKPKDDIGIDMEEGTEEDQILLLYDQPDTLVHIVDSVDGEESAKISDELFSDENILSQDDVQLQQLVDNDGNPLTLTTADGQEIKVVSTISEDEQCIQGLLADGTLIPINLTMQDGKPVTAEVMGKNDLDLKPKNVFIETDNLLEDPLLDENSQKLTDPNKLQFLTEDGQNVCFITTYDMVENQSLANEYITMQ